jgi:predicted nucleic acid-binding protein
MRSNLNATGSGGTLVNDAFLASMAAQRRASIVSFDNDFTRFPGVHWLRPPG